MASDIAPPLGQKPIIGKYTAEDREISLRTLALNGGNLARTVSQLAESGRAIDKQHLQYWRDVQHTRRYSELCAEVANDLSANTAGEAMEIAVEASRAERAYVSRALEEVENVEGKDLARSAQALSQVKVSQVQVARLLREQPTSITETRDLGELVDALERSGVFRDPDRPPGDHIESSAEEISDGASVDTVGRTPDSPGRRHRPLSADDEA